MSLDRLGTLLELVGTIIAASALFGEERLTRFENRLQRYLRYRERVNDLARRLRPISETVFKIVLYPFVFIFGLALTLLIISGFVYAAASNKVELMDWFAGRGPRPDPLYSISWPAVLCGPVATLMMLAVLFGRRMGWWEGFMTAGLFYLMGPFIVVPDMARSLGKFLANILARVIYGVVLVIVVLFYALTYLLLSPYLLSRGIANRFHLRPTLGVLGFLITFVGLAIQLR